jgi:hypothetical protein
LRRERTMGPSMAIMAPDGEIRWTKVNCWRRRWDIYGYLRFGVNMCNPPYFIYDWNHWHN